MKISVLTLFPEMFEGPFDHSIIKRAIEGKLLEIELINIRDFGKGKHKIVDDRPYGGGKGMILKVDVLKSAIEASMDKKISKKNSKIILLSAKGDKYNQNFAKTYSKLEQLILICGHYEGVDERILDYVDDEISIGDFVLTGGEIAAMSIIDSTARLIPGVLDSVATDDESHSKQGILEYPQYTRPEVFEGKKVPYVLINGNHEKIKEWREKKKINRN